MPKLARREPTTATRLDPTNDPTQQPPTANVRYFYTSLSSIDDPLAPVNIPPKDSATLLHQRPRPFSEYDSSRLDKAWCELRLKLASYREHKVEQQRKEAEQKWHSGAHRPSTPTNRRHDDGREHSQQGRQSPVGSPSPRQSAYHPGTPEMKHGRGFSSSFKSSSSFQTPADDKSGKRTRRGSNLSQRVATASQLEQEDHAESTEDERAGLTHTPFIRAPPKMAPARQLDRSEANENNVRGEMAAPSEASTALEEPVAKTPVGESRLHQVVMPSLKMEPIYWSPVNDVVSVLRATWFYKDSMLPVETQVANLLEAGYVKLKPWTQTWADELSSAVEVGAAGETKIAHALWPQPTKTQPKSLAGSLSSAPSQVPDNESPEKRQESIVASAMDVVDHSTLLTPSVDNKAAGESTYGNDGRVRKYSESAVIYANATDAYILRASLQPSSYYGRRPLANYIQKGYNIGIRVVRGFDQEIYDRRYPTNSKSKPAANKTNTRQGNSQRVDPALNPFTQRRSETTDLVLVIHGIGQKLSETMESFHFTHAMNGFRRDVKGELESPVVTPFLRKDMGNIMVLPCNWRSTLSLEEGGYRDGTARTEAGHFSLKDIMPETLPNVRSIISDVMLDIPYYLSHHQPKMIASVIDEANRIYRLWCQNNPGFQKYGRIHLLAHSLGSVMALDILSKQPTRVDVTPFQKPREQNHFEFDTTNLYLAGSPAGFFLLLKQAGLVPRRDRNKPAAEGEDSTPGIVGEEGDYGCLAVDNIYNIINPYDPVANCLNAAIDADWASTIKPAFIPSASASWFSFGNPFRSVQSASNAASSSGKRPKTGNRLPSNVELEIHNFTREEIAEKRSFLLNDNGQIDYYMRYGGGTFEIQYLTMLGAHSSYWISKDFARFIVVETGRKPGRDGTLVPARAVKKKTYAR